MGDGIERRATKNAVSNVLGINSLGGISPLTAAVIVKSDEVENIKDTA